MWVLHWKKYALSKFATFVSVIGAFMRYAGVSCLVSGLIPGALICIAIGIGLHFGAEYIAKSKANKLSGNAINGKSQSTEAIATKTTTTKTNAAQPTPKPAQVNKPYTAAAQPTTSANKNVKCDKCGALVSNTNKFCTKCGNALITETLRPKECFRCGANIDSESRFCPNCGCEIEGQLQR